jgi:hypothetical protein
MNLKNITEGMIVKNYKELCNLLGEEPTTGTAKIAQLKRWARYFDYEKNGHKFIIKEIYASPLPEDFSNNDVYSKYIQTILAKYLKRNGCGEFTMTQLLRLCGFVNENWNDVTMLDKYTDVQNISYAKAMYYYNQLYCHVYSYCTRAIIRCLDRLSSRSFLEWNKVLYIQIGNEKRLATQKEIEEYLNISYGVRKEMGIKYTNAYNKDKYYKRLDAKLKEHGWDTAFYLIRIVYATKYIDDMIKESEEEYKEALLCVNDHCLQQIYKYVDVDIENDIKKLANKMNEDIELAELCFDIEAEKQRRIDIANFFVSIKMLELEGKL